MGSDSMIVALAGGVGGAKLADGLARVVAPDGLTIVVNTGDDFEHLGLYISPDLDTVMYTLAGHNNSETGWGLAGETWAFMAALERVGGETWFRLGDQDLATHVERTRRLGDGDTLSGVTAELCKRFGIRHSIVPMSDDPIRTMVLTSGERLAFQDYFVRLRCTPRVTGFEFDGSTTAYPSPKLSTVMKSDSISAAIICPSNPYVSVGPILAIPQFSRWISERNFPIVAVSPIVGGKALKGPAAKMMAELNVEVSALAVARHYGALVDGMIIDVADKDLAPAIEAEGTRVAVTGTIMNSAADRARLAKDAITFAETLDTR